LGNQGNCVTSKRSGLKMACEIPDTTEKHEVKVYIINLYIARALLEISKFN